MKIVLYQPEIPQNTGNIVRTCALTRSKLVLVRPLGFSTSDRMLKRAGLDYWHAADIEIIDDLTSYLEETDAPFYFFSRHASRVYSEETFSNDSLCIFGSETKGLCPSFREKWPERFLQIPCSPILRADTSDSGCLNLSNAVSIVLYEALRQSGFAGLVPK